MQKRKQSTALGGARTGDLRLATRSGDAPTVDAFALGPLVGKACEWGAVDGMRLRQYLHQIFARLKHVGSGLQGQRARHSCVQEDILAAASGGRGAGVGEAGGGAISQTTVAGNQRQASSELRPQWQKHLFTPHPAVSGGAVFGRPVGPTRLQVP